MSNDQIIAVAEDAELQDEEQKDQLIEDLQAVFDEYGLSESRLRLYDGPVYGQINMHMHCPDCGDSLQFRRPEPTGGNAAATPAKCSCGWSGDAIYRVIDLMENQDEHQTRLGDLLKPASSVAADNSDVSYTPYADTDVHKS